MTARRIRDGQVECRCFDANGLLVAKVHYPRPLPRTIRVIDEVAEREAFEENMRRAFADPPPLKMKPLMTHDVDLIGVEVDSTGTWARYEARR